MDALGEAARRPAVAAGRFDCFGLVAAFPEAAVARAAGALVEAPTGARRRWLARCGRDFGSRLMMSGALVAGWGPPAPFARACLAGAALAGALDWLLGGVAPVAPAGGLLLSIHGCLP